jgi:hypothetical protein
LVLITEFLDLDELASDAAKGVAGAEVIVEAGLGVGTMRLQREQDLAQVSGHDLEASGSQVGILVVEDVKGGFFVESVSGEALLEQEPILVAALEPIGDVADGDVVTTLGKGVDNGAVRGGVFQHLVDEVAFGLGEGSDFAGAAAET